jgi:acyl homoserine lactone synthase
MTTITIARAGEAALRAPLMDSMYRLRSQVFHSRLGWDVHVENGREHDWFDLIGPHYLVAHEKGGGTRALGCCRLLPTLGPNMLRDVFPGLVDEGSIPAHETIWEVSRFAVSGTHGEGGYGFSQLPAAMVAEVLRFAAMQGLQSIVGVTSAPFERMLHRLGLRVERLGKPRRIGRVMSLAFCLPVDEANLSAIASIRASDMGDEPIAMPRAA